VRRSSAGPPPHWPTALPRSTSARLRPRSSLGGLSRNDNAHGFPVRPRLRGRVEDSLTRARRVSYSWGDQAELRVGLGSVAW